MSATLHFLGCSDSKGVPRFWCNCTVCLEARTVGHNRRTRPSAVVRGRNGEKLLLDCGPDLHTQLCTLGGPFVPDAVLISHAHNDHLLGLGDLLDFVTYAGGSLRIYAPAAILPDVQARFAYAYRKGAPVQPIPEGGLDLCGFRVQAFEVPHGANGTSHAFHFQATTTGTTTTGTATTGTTTTGTAAPGPAEFGSAAPRPLRWVYMTDAIGVPASVAARWLDQLDLLVLGSSFADESAAEDLSRSVYDVREALALPWARAARRVLLTHLSHDIDVRQPLPERHFAYASDGLSVSLSAPASTRTGRP